MAANQGIPKSTQYYHENTARVQALQRKWRMNDPDGTKREAQACSGYKYRYSQAPTTKKAVNWYLHCHPNDANVTLAQMIAWCDSQ